MSRNVADRVFYIAKSTCAWRQASIFISLTERGESLYIHECHCFTGPSIGSPVLSCEIAGDLGVEHEISRVWGNEGHQ